MPNVSDISGAEVPKDEVAPVAAPTLKRTPLVSVVDARNVSVVDTTGRVIGVKKLLPLDVLKLSRAVGGVGSQNPLEFHFATIAASVTSLDGVPVAFPHAPLAIDATIARLDEAGIEAVLTALATFVPVDEDVADAAKSL